MKAIKLLFIGLIAFTTSVFADIGKIIALKGEVNIVRDTKTIQASLGSIVEEKDKVTTGKNGRVQIVFKDKTLISLGKNSNFDIQGYFFDEKKPEKTKASFKVSKGIFKSITGKIGKINRSKFKLRTKTSTIGIRGTTFFGDVSEDGQERISCTSGAITVSTSKGVVEVPAGKFTKVSLGSAPTVPAAITPREQENLEKSSGAYENEEESGQNQQTIKRENLSINLSSQTENTLESDFTDQSNGAYKDEREKNSQDDNEVSNSIAKGVSTSGSDSSENSSSSSTATSPKTATYTALHGVTFKETVGIGVNPGTTGQTGFFEQASNPSYSISNGVLSGSSTLSRTEVTSSGNVGGGTRTFTLPNITLSNPATSYTKYTKLKTVPFTVTAFGNTESMDLNLFGDSMEEFFVGHSNKKFTPQGVSDEFTYDEYLVFGTPTTQAQLPTNGISRYVEPTASGNGGAAMKGENLPYMTSINWKNKRILSYEIGSDDSFFAYIGTVGSDGKITHKNYFEVNNDFNQKIVLNGTSSHNKGYIYGSQHQGWGATIGLKANVNSPVDFVTTVGEFRHTDSSYEKTASDTGSVDYKGFTTQSNEVTGKSISFTLNKDGGTLSDGVISLGSSVDFGGESTSAYIDNNTFASIIGNNEGWLATIPSRTSESEHFESDYISWGLWAKKGSTTKPQPWVAGDNSKLVQDISSAILSASLSTATYKGPAMGYKGDTFIDPKNSSMTLEIDFGGNIISAALKANGGLFFTGDLGNGNGGGGSFSASDSYSFSDSTGNNRVGGKFYDNMKNTIGSFKFQSGTEIAHGVYKATKQ